MTTNFNPVRFEDFDTTKLAPTARGVSVTASVNGTTNLDYALPDDTIFAGAILIVGSTALFGDYIDLQVLDDGSGTYTGIPNSVIKQPITSWYVAPSMVSDFTVLQPVKGLAGMVIRVSYHSTAGILGAAVFLAVDYKLHKVLI